MRSKEPLIERCPAADFRELHDCMNAAFSDYIVPMSLSFDQFHFMLTQRGYDPELSVIARVGDQIASFCLVGTDTVDFPVTAYVIATGTLPRYRGRGLSRTVFQSLQENLPLLGKTTLRLEVIRENLAAVSLYEKLGFRPIRKLICYEIGTTTTVSNSPGPIELRAVELSDIQDQLDAMQDWQPSWQHSIQSLIRVAPEVMTIAAFRDGGCLGYGSLLRPTSTIGGLAVRSEQRRKGIGSAILAALTQDLSKFAVLNIDCADDASRSLFEGQQVAASTTQIEMICPISGQP